MPYICLLAKQKIASCILEKPQDTVIIYTYGQDHIKESCYQKEKAA